MAVYQAVHPGISHDQNWPLAIMGIGPRVELETGEFLLAFGLGQDERVGRFEHGDWTASALMTTKVSSNSRFSVCSTVSPPLRWFSRRAHAPSNVLGTSVMFAI